MKIKKPSIAVVLFVIFIAAYIAASVIFCYNTKPEVTDGEFPFSITYEYKGKTKTLSGVFHCEFSGSDTIHLNHRRYWESETVYDNPDNLEEPFVIDSNQEEQTVLWMVENMEAGYFMGDPQYEDYYSRVYGLDGVEPRVEYDDYKNGTSLDDENRAEVLESIGFKIIGYTYAEPIENSFSFAGIEYEADNIILFISVVIAYLILCLIFVRKDKEYRYSVLDKIGIVLNVLGGIVVIPVISMICMLFGIVESDIGIVNAITYNIPPFALLCIALSVVFRRKGYPKTGFFIQFGGILPVAVMFVLELIFRFH